ncbi:sensor histidine kinase [Paenibacillus prosopidis]|uniref:Histidine kinase/DNA gyrase B/HSP90-like ATPase n=1 Tax=Paenibacillus prosopidis TaxID=630520 RepID=A0A368W1G1_9BACL|nr:histidine kinase [Paenibacillus prosopidis]RCW47603.1 histidine kinase/DNA gyrase B/HSP90-like ATPase [Paenibacillus prosopidis]
MNKETRRKTFIPFTYKMMIPYLILVLLTDVFIGYISYTMLIESRTEMAETNIRTAMEQTRNNVKYQLDEITRMSDTLFSSLSFQRALQRKGDPLQNYLTMMDEIVPQMKGPLQLYGNNIRLLVYTTNEDLNYIQGDDLTEQIKDSDYYVLPINEIANSSWFQALKDSDMDNLWLQVDSDKKLEHISHFRKLVSYSDYKTVIGYVRITTRLTDLLGDFNSFPVEEGIILRLFDETSGTNLFQRGETSQRISAESFLILRESIPETGFVIETLVPYSYLEKDASRLQSVIIMVCSISFLFMAFIGFIVARLSGRKMKRIVAFLRSFQEGNFQKRIRFSGNDEFVHIADAFNVMATNTQELINRVYVQGIQKKQAELEALQAQINPHFLYNTLSTISSLANLGETQKVTGMVSGLAKFYRLSLNQGNVYIPLEKELEQIETYLDIQKVKYADAFTVYFDIEPDIKDIQVIKLILQPFVENIFKHAWFGDKIAIRITGKRIGDRIELKVIDNGIGMRPNTVKNLLIGPSQLGGYGLKNVDDRIKLRYGDEFGIHIGSIYGGGTTVQILLPDRRHNQE